MASALCHTRISRPVNPVETRPRTRTGGTCEHASAGAKRTRNPQYGLRSMTAANAGDGGWVKKRGHGWLFCGRAGSMPGSQHGHVPNSRLSRSNTGSRFDTDSLNTGSKSVRILSVPPPDWAGTLGAGGFCRLLITSRNKFRLPITWLSKLWTHLV